MRRATIAAATAAALALVGTPALVGTASAAPNETAAGTAGSGKVQASKWGSYVVVMEADPLVATYEQDALVSTKAQQDKKKLEASHANVLKRAGLSSTSVAAYLPQAGAPKPEKPITPRLTNIRQGRTMTPILASCEQSRSAA